MSTMDPTRVRKPAGDRWRPGHRGDRASDSSWWSGACSRTSAELGTSEIRRYSIFGTIMAANVWMHILPAHKRMIAALKEGRKPDDRLSAQAKLRS